MMLLFFLLTYTIADIKVSAKWADTQLIKETLGFKIGDEFQESMLSQAIDNLNKLHLFNFLAIDTSIIGDGIFLKVIVDEAPFLSGEPDFSGNKIIKNKDLKKKIELKPGQVLTAKAIADAKNKILTLYTEKTFYNTTVQESLILDTLNRAKLLFIISEGTQLRINKIKIEGNNFFSDQKIKRKMANKEKGFLRSGKLNKEKLTEDIEKIAAFYKENGFLDIQIDEPKVEVENDRLIITISLKENIRYYVGQTSFSGNKLFTAGQLAKSLKFKTDDVYNLGKTQQTLQDLYSLYADEGYIYASIVPVEDVKDSIIDIEYVINESSPANINRVLISGNYRTKEKVIRREILTMPGERFRRSMVIRSQREVFNLGFFEDIQIGTGTPDDSGNLDLIYKIKEKEGIGSVGAGMSYDRQDKLVGYVELSTPNLFGRGQQIYTKFQLGGRLTDYQIRFTEPWLFDTRTSAGVELYYTNRLWDYYTKRDIGMATRLSFPFYLDYTRLNYTFRIERTQILDIAKSYTPSGSYNLRNDTIPKWTMGNSFGIIRDTRDFIFNPSSGSYLSVQTEFAKKFLFANIDYNQLTFEARTYYPLFWKFVLMTRLRTGIVTSVDEVPLYKRFYAGGVGEDGVRGYPDRSLSPKEDGRAAGGKAIFINNVELKLKLSQGFAFLVFYDMGNAFPSYKEANLHNLYRGLGAGIRLEIPMIGVLGFDLGYGFDRERPGFEPHFQINPFGMF